MSTADNRYTVKELLVDLGSVICGPCVVCGEKTEYRTTDKDGNWIFVCDYPKSCKLKLHEAGRLY